MFRNWLAYWLLVGVTVTSLFNFLLIAKYGAVILYEPDSNILVGEMITCVVIIALGIERVVHQIRSKGR
jgi:L-lactate utilization protein LutB